MAWIEPKRIPICRDSAGRPVDLIDFGDGKKLVQIGNAANVDLFELEAGIERVRFKIEDAS
jgi:hypothetical protein